MSTEQENSQTSHLKTKIIILGSVSFLALQNFLSVFLYKLNFPYSVDYTDIFVPVYNFLVNGENLFFINKNIHVILFPKIIALPNFYFNSFDVVNISYLIWFFISLTVFFLYLILKQTDKKLVWAIIPISAFLYNPLTTHNSYSMAMLSWFIPMFGLTLIVYLLNKKTINYKIFASSISIAILSTFSILLGVVTWIIGFFMLLKLFTEKKAKSKKWLPLWIISTILVGISYFSLITSHDPSYVQLNTILSYKTFSFVTNFLASSFRLKYQFLMILVGAASLILSGIFIFYLQKKNCLKNYFPWIAFLITTFLAANITALGRMNLDGHLGNEPFYSTISQFFQIGLLVLCFKIILDLYNKPKTPRQNIIFYLLILLIISQMFLLVPSYYAGWQRAEYYFEERMIDLNCFSLKPIQKCIETHFDNNIINERSEILSSINYMIENNQSIFSEKEFEKVNYETLQIFSNYPQPTQTKTIGQITNINDRIFMPENNYNLKDVFLKIDGTTSDSNYKNIEKIYLKIDNELLIEYNDFQILEYNHNDPSIVNWTIFIISGYIPQDCNALNIYVTQNEKINSLVDEITICK